MTIKSPLGYDPQIGARFYGIGNELMGVLIGASVMLFSILLDLGKNKRIITLVSICMILLLILVVTPGLGSKAGAAIAVTTSFLTLIIMRNGSSYKKIFLIIASVLVVILAISLIDAAGVPQTHVGRSIKLIISGGWTEALDIIVRKINMNLRLMRYSYWSGVLVASLISLLILIKFKIKFIAHIEKQCPQTLNGIYSSLVGAIVALATNDAGIIAAATASIYPICTLLMFNLVEKEVISY